MLKKSLLHGDFVVSVKLLGDAKTAWVCNFGHGLKKMYYVRKVNFLIRMKSQYSKLFKNLIKVLTFAIAYLNE